MAEVNKIAYAKELAAYLAPNNAFYKFSKLVNEAADAESYLIPQLSKPASVHRGAPESLPAKIKIANDGKLTAPMLQFWADPIAISGESEVVTNYSKRQAHQMQQAAQIETGIADYAFYQWAPTASGLIVPTTGAARAISATGLTGTRKAVTKDDLIKVQGLIRKSNIFNLPGQIYAVVTDDVYSDLLAIDSFVDYQKLGVAEKLSKGIIGKILGIEIMSRTNELGHAGALMKADGTEKYFEATTAATDRPISLFWHEAYVSRGEGAPMANVTANAPGYLGATIIEAWKRFGANVCREDYKGTVSLVEAA